MSRVRVMVSNVRVRLGLAGLGLGRLGLRGLAVLELAGLWLGLGLAMLWLG